MEHQSWDMKTLLCEEIKKHGGFVNSHAHFDKAYYISKETLEQSMVTMEAKWKMSDDIKKNSSEQDIESRIKLCLEKMIEQGCTLTCSFIDAYSAVDHKAINAANNIKEKYKNQITFLTATQPLDGLTDIQSIQRYEAITQKADIAGGLPSKDRPHIEKHFENLFSIAKNLNKPIHVHIDQENNPNERDTELLIKYTKKFGYEGRVVAVHAISVSAQEKSYRAYIYKSLADLGIGVIVNPSAALGMKQLDHFASPTHNSIANVPEMIQAGVLVALGVDNIADFYQPFVDGDLWIELRILQEACRFYDFQELVRIASINGRKLLNIN